MRYRGWTDQALEALSGMEQALVGINELEWARTSLNRPRIDLIGQRTGFAEYRTGPGRRNLVGRRTGPGYWSLAEQKTGAGR